MHYMFTTPGQAQVKFPSITIYPPHPPPISPTLPPSSSHHTVAYVHELFPLFSFLPNFSNPLWLSPIPHPTTCRCLPALCLWVSIFLLSSLCSLDSTYEWNHMVFIIFDWLISLSIMLSRTTHAVAKGKISFFFYGQVVYHCAKVPWLLCPFL